MCHCEEVRRSNLLVFAGFLSLKLKKSFNLCSIHYYLRVGIGSNLADCFVVPPRNDTFFLSGVLLIINGQGFKLKESYG
jgi:hypothetical protein